MAMIPVVSAEVQEGTTGLNDNISDSANELMKNQDIQTIIGAAISSERIQVDEKNQTFLNLYESPGEKIIKGMKTRAYSDSQITVVLSSQGYSWDPKTGACWKGTAPTEAELKIINQIRGKNYSPFNRESTLQKTALATTSLRQEYRQMRTTSGTTYFGVYDYMKPGQMVTSSTGTYQHVVTTHVGRKTSSTTECWVEAGVADSVADPQRRYFTYDNDEGGWSFHGNAGAADVSTYQIYVSDTLESAGYKYNVWINGNWVRTGHLAFRQNYVDQANEIWADGTNAFSSDTSITNFRDSYLYHNNGYSWWATNVPTDFNSVGSRISQSKVVSGNAYDWQMWIP